MPSIFSRIIAGELPGTFVWKDDRCVAFLSIAPMMPGHTLVVPRAEVDHWIDLDPDLAAHLFTVAQQIGKAQDLEWHPARIGMLIVGEEVPHVHVRSHGVVPRLQEVGGEQIPAGVLHEPDHVGSRKHARILMPQKADRHIRGHQQFFFTPGPDSNLGHILQPSPWPT